MEFGETKETFLLFRGGEWRAKGDRRRGTRSCGRCRMCAFGSTCARTFCTAIRDDQKFILALRRCSKVMFHFHRLVLIIKVLGIEAKVKWRGGLRRIEAGFRDVYARVICVAGDVAIL